MPPMVAELSAESSTNVGEPDFEGWVHEGVDSHGEVLEGVNSHGEELLPGAEQAELDIAAVMREAEENEPQGEANLRGSVATGGWWGHAHAGETCCMCAKTVGQTTLLFAVADYDHTFGVHTAYWWCSSVCGNECANQASHQFGCYDESHLLQMDRMYGTTTHSASTPHTGGAVASAGTSA